MQELSKESKSKEVIDKFIEHEYVTLRLRFDNLKNELIREDFLALSEFHSKTGNQFIIPYKD